MCVNVSWFGNNLHGKPFNGVLISLFLSSVSLRQVPRHSFSISDISPPCFSLLSQSCYSFSTFPSCFRLLFLLSFSCPSKLCYSILLCLSFVWSFLLFLLRFCMSLYVLLSFSLTHTYSSVLSCSWLSFFFFTFTHFLIMSLLSNFSLPSLPRIL